MTSHHLSAPVLLQWHLYTVIITDEQLLKCLPLSQPWASVYRQLYTTNFTSSAYPFVYIDTGCEANHALPLQSQGIGPGVFTLNL